MFFATIAILVSQCNTENSSEDTELFQGDMALTAEQRRMIQPVDENDINVNRRLAIQSDKNLWPNGIIYYLNNFKNDPKMSQVIKDAMNHIESRTCLRFKEVQRTGQVPTYAYITNERGKGCWSVVGYNKGKQLVSLEQPKCTTMNVVVHELLHAAGLWHMHSRPDRDNYLRIYRDNVQPNMRKNFDKVQGRYTPGNFDYDSIMLYDSTFFSQNGKDTMVKKDGSRLPNYYYKKGMSQTDVNEINNLYHCNQKRG